MSVAVNGVFMAPEYMSGTQVYEANKRAELFRTLVSVARCVAVLVDLLLLAPKWSV
jgi:hypothetical protein